jgi:hypothetical protein
MEELPPSILFQWSIASILSSNEMPSGINSSIVPESLLEDRIQIDGINLQWLFEASDGGLEYGDNLGKFPGVDPSVGVMWWDGGAGTIIYAQCEATYLVTVRATYLSTVGESGHLKLESDLSPTSQFIVQDRKWQEFKSQIHLTKGPHLIGLRYLKDIGDAIIEWIQINRVTPCEI